MAQAITPPSPKLLKMLDREVPEDRIAKISLLKHRIDHLFLPTAIDLQGIADELHDEEKELDERKKAAEEYLGEIFDARVESMQDRQGDNLFYYRNRLNRARYLAVGHREADTRQVFKLDGLGDAEEQALKAWLASAQPEAILPEGKAMWDLVQEALVDEEKKSEITTHWAQFIKLLGLCQVDDSTFKCNSTSPIQQFMHKMDCWLKEYPKLPEPNEVLDFFKQYQDWGIKDIRIHSFSDWFSKLADAMDKLRESLKPDLR